MIKKIKKIIKQLLKKTIPIWRHFLSQRCTIDPGLAQTTLEEFSPKPTGTPIAQNTLMDPICDLQIIIPAYNVEQYLEECLDSILSQETQYSYKVVLIDDGSTDKTPEIAEKYSIHDSITVIHQENKGFSGARNTGLQNLFAKYIMFVDSDDKLYPGAIESLLHTAFEHDCDIVEGGAFFLIGEELKSYFSHPETKQIPEALGTFHGQPWAKIFRASCFEKIAFPEGFWFEDTIMAFLLYRTQQRYCTIDKNVYVYRKNANGISYSHGGKPKSLDSYWITEKLMEICHHLQYPFDDTFFDNFLHQVIMNQIRIAKLPVIIQQSVFILSCEMMTHYFPNQIITNHKNSHLVKALITQDWGLFRILYRLC